MRIGRASDAYPVVTPHVIARRMRTSVNSLQRGSKVGDLDETSAMDVDQEYEEEDVSFEWIFSKSALDGDGLRVKYIEHFVRLAVYLDLGRERSLPSGD